MATRLYHCLFPKISGHTVSPLISHNYYKKSHFSDSETASWHQVCHHIHQLFIADKLDRLSSINPKNIACFGINGQFLSLQFSIPLRYCRSCPRESAIGAKLLENMKHWMKTACKFYWPVCICAGGLLQIEANRTCRMDLNQVLHI